MPPRNPIVPVLLVIAASMPTRYEPSCSLNTSDATFGSSLTPSTMANWMSRIVLRDRLENRRLREADADDEVVLALGKRAHRGLDVDRRARLDIAHDDAEARLSAVGAVRQRAGLGALHPVPCRGVERTVVLAADIEHDAGLGRRRIADRVASEGCRRREAPLRTGLKPLSHRCLCHRCLCHLTPYASQHLVDDERRRAASAIRRRARLPSAAAAHPPASSADRYCTRSTGSPARTASPTVAGIMIPTRRIDLVIYFVAPAAEHHRPPGRSGRRPVP